MSNIELLIVVISLLLIPVYIIVGFYVEKQLLNSVERDEDKFKYIKIIDVKTVPDNYLNSNCQAQMVCGSITVAGSYLKSFFASWRNLFGGEVKSYKSLLDVARRAAIVRMKREAAALNADCIINVKFSTANIMHSNSQQTNTSVEVLVYGTALIH